MGRRDRKGFAKGWRTDYQIIYSKGEITLPKKSRRKSTTLLMPRFVERGGKKGTGGGQQGIVLHSKIRGPNPTPAEGYKMRRRVREMPERGERELRRKIGGGRIGKLVLGGKG